ncbi:MAG: sensory histidine kinase AtoS [Methanoregula sp. PtaU1.Bin051]|nr:MAG: sensory histidine kinase AtoS [Methanoregula sp. PtaU1.Bin051]
MAHSFITRIREHPNAPLALISISLIIVFTANLYGLLRDVSIVTPHLFYIPIIIAAFFYPRRGVLFAIVLSVAYLLMVIAVRPDNSPDIVSAGARCIVFVIIAAVVSYLSQQVSEREIALRESEEKYRAIIEKMQDIFYRTDLDGKITMLSPSAAQLAGYDSVNLIIGQDIAQLYADNAEYEKLLAVIREKGSVNAYPIRLRTRDGSIRHVTTSSHLYRNASGEVLGFEGVIHDITDQRRAEEALRSALKKLNMLSSITRHDILNQIMGLRTYLELSKDDLKGTKFEDYIEKEDKAAATIQRQIEFTKFYQDIGVNEPKWHDMGAVIREAAGQLNLAAVDLTVTVEGIWIYADPLIVKVFFNLMENSLRHGERVTRLEFSSLETEAGLVITYRDNGVEISYEDKKKLFQRGFGKHTGLGLFLSQEILAITGITIAENGEPGSGVRFEITVPKGGYRFS